MGSIFQDCIRPLLSFLRNGGADLGITPQEEHFFMFHASKIVKSSLFLSANLGDPTIIFTQLRVDFGALDNELEQTIFESV